MRSFIKYIIISFLLLTVSLSAQIRIPGTELPGEDGRDTTISIPNEFYNNLDNLLHSWIVGHAQKSNCRNSEIPTNITDSVYKLRLSKLPCIMEMPFNNSVKAFIELYTVRKRQQMEYMLGMSDYYFPIFEHVLNANNLPLELKNLPIIESALNATAVSRVGAAGLWQFMIPTGRMYGLEVNSLVDERLDPVKSTHAAARFLKDLFSMYGDWHLVIAAYNCGPGNVNKAIRRSGGKRDYWAIYPYLPAETRGYVPIFIAANYSTHYAAQHNICKAKVNMPVITDTIMIKEKVHFEQISQVLNIPIEQIKLLNPQYKKNYIPGNIKPYALCLPLNYANGFYEKYDEIVKHNADTLINNRRDETEILTITKPVTTTVRGQVKYHTVKKGQTLGYIAAKYGTSVTKLKKANNIKGSMIQLGQRLKIVK
ncbi:MAG: transglycosylase SLT domain-containing protein [Paludibacter sp.]